MLRLAALAPGDTTGLADRLRLSTAERATLEQLAGPVPPVDADDAELRRALAHTPNETLVGRAWLAHGRAGEALRARLAAMARPRFALAGRDALALGVPPGPRVGELIRGVRDWWLEGGCVADPAACRTELARRAGQLNP
jgi:poly(A) polymerase/tRNA nucleotidyltransferase (CCA-adding enzyme)